MYKYTKQNPQPLFTILCLEDIPTNWDKVRN